MYGQAFLLMNLGRYDKALAAYRRIANYSYEGEVDMTLPQIINFNENQLTREPNRIEPHFILGYLKFKKNLNYPEALEHLETFVAKATDKKFKLVVAEANKCIQELHKIMGVSPVDN
jgi:hypothetical protein